MKGARGARGAAIPYPSLLTPARVGGIGNLAPLAPPFATHRLRPTTPGGAPPRVVGRMYRVGGVAPRNFRQVDRLPRPLASCTGLGNSEEALSPFVRGSGLLR